MSSRKYLKKSFEFDLIYRSSSKNPLAMPYIKKSSLIASDTTSLPKILSLGNIFKVLPSSGLPKICLSPVSSNELSLKKGDPLSCALVLSKNSTLDFLSMCAFSFSSVPLTPVFSTNLYQKVVSFRFRTLSSFFSYSYYESSVLLPQSNLGCTFSIYFSRVVHSNSVVLFSALLPYHVSKKKINTFRIILREMEQSG